MEELHRLKTETGPSAHTLWEGRKYLLASLSDGPLTVTEDSGGKGEVEKQFSSETLPSKYPGLREVGLVTPQEKEGLGTQLGQHPRDFHSYS
jgi:hypothetical protein